MFSDEALVARSKNGDIDAFEELVSCYERKIYNVAYRLMGNHEDANDLAQEAFFRAFQSISNFRGEASFLTWMCRIVTNLCRDELRKKYRTQIESLDGEITLGEGEVKKQVASSEPGPAELYEKKELREKIQELINTLSPEFRLALVLRDIQGFTYEEIAEQLECSLGTVKSRINRARKYLKDKLVQDWEQKEVLTRLYR
ncbi:sigma-70 family RNA polymerase sigma factor [Thermanaerosceptrum fracticalcis]|uniref:Sigma-70 family RNA polymerase sigma factor n=1 Tax=Thermanaerosceptrum fracticalcis TaxID=1712410 RepID=A0A7G6DYG3_THEFR|nr:sigma-70 family RNA polymerase sigma factor [Thermanaerosceptrum fracticalcis]QNB44867.1 sigma-70 family RNA polymerase sigma factor [Thermanaerosceptrum fracticalcis]